MKYNLLIIMSLLFIFRVEAQNNTNDNKTGFRLEVDIPSQKNQKVYLGYYWKGATYARDSLQLSASGNGKFAISGEIMPGQYFIYIKPDFRIDLLFDKGQNDVRLSINEDDFSKSTVSGSNDTKLLWNYLFEIQKRDTERAKLEEQLENPAITKQKKNSLEKQLSKLDESTQAYKEKVIRENKGNWFGAFTKGMESIELPYKNPINTTEFSKNKEYGKMHFFDNIDLSDFRFWYTNYLDSYIDTYMLQWVDQIPDSLAYAACNLVEKAKGNELCSKEMLSKLTNDALKSLRMGDENIWSRLAEQYIFDKDVVWIDSIQNAELRRKYELIKNNRIGMKAHNITLQTIDGKTINTNDIQAEYLILYFYDTDCVHCQISTPQLHNKLYAKYKSKGLEIVAINLNKKKEEWNTFVKDKKLTDWFNCADPEYKSLFWMYYNTSGVPSVYVLSKDKTIIAKNVDEQNLEKLFDFYLNDKNGTN